MVWVRRIFFLFIFLTGLYKKLHSHYIIQMFGDVLYKSLMLNEATFIRWKIQLNLLTKLMFFVFKYVIYSFIHMIFSEIILIN